jgi:tRNA G18 (ribose-2'-O)-methylase SpoU
MSRVPLHDLRDPRVADYQDLRESELVRARGLFVAEGRLVVGRVVEDLRWRIRSLLLNEAAYAELEPALSTHRAETPAFVCRTADFLTLTGVDIHRGCLALVERLPDRDIGMLLDDPAMRTIVVLEDVANADNVGGVFRNAAAFGADAVLLSPECCDPFYRKAVRTSMAATLRVPFARVEAWPADLSMLRHRGFTVVALTPRLLSETPLESIDEFARRVRPDRLALVVGSEGQGLTAAVEAIVDHRIRIPIAPGVDSLNLSVAAGIALHLLSRRL